MDELLEKVVTQKMLQDIDGTNFYIRQRRNGQDTAKLVSDAKKLIAEQNLSVSEAKGFLEYMKIVIDSEGSLQQMK